MTRTLDPDASSPPNRLVSQGPVGLNRRHFLQSIGALGAASMLPLKFAEMAAAATPVGPKDGIIVLITMNGGCDGLDLVVPIDDGTYYQRRSGMAIPAASTHQISASHGLHPALSRVKERWDQGQVAVIEGVGDPNGNMSHVDNMARLKAGQTGERTRTTGWLGRYVDGLPGANTGFPAISFGASIPLDSIGTLVKATGLRTQYNRLVDPRTAEPWDRRHILAMQSFGLSTTGKGPLADLLGRASYDAVEMASDLAPLYSPDLPEGDLAGQMVMAARLINANLGIRVLSLSFGDFDGHANQRAMYEQGMAELDDGVDRFLTELNFDFMDRVMILTTTEFGRRLQANRSGGTDHGTAATYLAIGSQVKGGIYGQRPSLTNLDADRNLRIEVDYRSVYGTILERWLRADSAQILGANYEDLDFTHAPATVDPGPHPAYASGLERRNQLIRLYLAYFLRMPEASGLDYWVGRRMSGASIDAVSSAFAGSPEFRRAYGELSNSAFVRLVYNNVLERNADASGLGFWSSELDRGVSRGQVMTGFSDSKEYRAKTGMQIDEFDRSGPVARLYRAYFLRAPERSGRDYWSSSGKPLGAISQAFAESPEFQNRYGSLSNADFVSLVYRNVLNRPAEGEGLAFWTAQLDAGSLRGDMMVQFSESAEFIASFD